MSDGPGTFFEAFDAAAAELAPLTRLDAPKSRTTDLVAHGLERGRKLRSASLFLAIGRLRKRFRCTGPLPQASAANTPAASPLAAE